MKKTGENFTACQTRYMIPLPLQTGITPLHFLSAIHFLESEPIKSNPASHLKVMVLEKVVFLPSEEPFVGGCKAPQSTAATDMEIYHQNNAVSSLKLPCYR